MEEMEIKQFYGLVSTSGYPYSIGINGGVLWYSAPATASHKFCNNGTNTLTIDQNGNVGIGYIDTSYKLSVNGGIRLNNNTACVTSFSMGGAGLFYVDGPGVVGGRFTILVNGNVGIGKSNHTTKLYVEGTLAAINISCVWWCRFRAEISNRYHF